MPDKSTVNKAFNTLLFQFLDAIIEIYPEEEDIATAKESFETYRKMNPTIISKLWYKMVYTPYKDVIEQGDITFFFNKDYNSDLQHVPNSKEVARIIDKIRTPISEMNTGNQKICADYILKLSKLSEMYCNM